MHRSGTSAITRALMVLGVELGHRLMPPKKILMTEDFSRISISNAINVALYRSLRSRQRWHSLIPMPTGELLHQKNAALRLQAIELLKSRLENVEYFGIKDPRLCCTLPFWQSIFGYLQLDVSYVIAIGNPISVARSLGKGIIFLSRKATTSGLIISCLPCCLHRERPGCWSTTIFF